MDQGNVKQKLVKYNSNIKSVWFEINGDMRKLQHLPMLDWYKCSIAVKLIFQKDDNTTFAINGEVDQNMDLVAFTNDYQEQEHVNPPNILTDYHLTMLTNRITLTK